MDPLSKEKIKTEIAAQIKDLGMNDVFNDEFTKQVYESALKKINEQDYSDKDISEEVDSSLLEDDEENEMGGSYENEGEEDVSPESEEQYPEEDGEKDSDGYQPEMPSFLNKIEPAEFIIFDENELSEGGVNLSNKKFRTFEDPDVKKSIHQCWIEDGKKKANIYIAKFEKIGDVEFDYLAGTSKFERGNSGQPEIPAEKENPYQQDSSPEKIESESGNDIESYINNAVDLKSMVYNYIENALKEKLNSGESMSESKEIKTSRSNSKNNLKISELAMCESKFKKINAPKDLIESLEGDNDKAKLISEGEEVQEWKLDDKTYYYPSDVISTNKCYIKL